MWSFQSEKLSICFLILFNSFFACRPLNFSVKACRSIMSRTWDDLVNDSSDEASPCDEVENGTLDLPNVSDEWTILQFLA